MLLGQRASVMPFAGESIPAHLERERGVRLLLALAARRSAKIGFLDVCVPCDEHEDTRPPPAAGPSAATDASHATTIMADNTSNTPAHQALIVDASVVDAPAVDILSLSRDAEAADEEEHDEDTAAASRCVVCLEDAGSGGTCCGGDDRHLVCADCLAHLCADAAARPIAHLTDEEMREWRYAVRCPCSALGCTGVYRMRDVDAVLQKAMSDDRDGDCALALYSALVSLAQAQQPLSALAPMHTPPDVPPTPVPRKPARSLPAAAGAGRPRPAVGAVLVKGSAAAARSAAAPAVAAASVAARAAAERRARREEKRAKAEAAAAAQAQVHDFIRTQFRLADGSYAAYMCGGCGFGPVDHMACSDLTAHHGERRGRGRGAPTISNCCPSCGWFTPEISSWPRWDGVRVGELT